MQELLPMSYQLAWPVAILIAWLAGGRVRLPVPGLPFRSRRHDRASEEPQNAPHTRGLADHAGSDAHFLRQEHITSGIAEGMVNAAIRRFRESGDGT